MHHIQRSVTKSLSALLPWLNSELAALRVMAAARRVRWLMEYKYRPDQPRVSAGQEDGGQWTRGGGSGRASRDPEPVRQTSVDTSYRALASLAATTFSPDGTLQAQVIANRDGSVATTEWDTFGVEGWAVRQTIRDEARVAVTTTEFRRDGSGEIVFGAAANGRYEIVDEQGALRLGTEGDVAGNPTGIVPEPASRLAFQAPGVGVMTEAGASVGAPLGAAAVIIIGATAFPSAAGGDSIESLASDLRLNQRDDGRPLAIERLTDGRWIPIDGVTSFAGGGETIVVDVGRLRAAIGSEDTTRAIEALGERASLTIVGESWEPDTGRQVGLRQRDIEQSCRMYPDYKAAVEWAASDVDRSDLTPSQYGAAVHVAVDHYFKINYPIFNPLSLQFNTEFSVRKGTGSAFYATRYGAAGTKRFDAYEDVGDGTVCGYDIKTGPRGLTPRRIAELRSAARGYYKSRNSDLEPKRVIILEVRPWR